MSSDPEPKLAPIRALQPSADPTPSAPSWTTSRRAPVRRTPEETPTIRRSDASASIAPRTTTVRATELVTKPTSNVTIRATCSTVTTACVKLMDVRPSVNVLRASSQLRPTPAPMWTSVVPALATRALCVVTLRAATSASVRKVWSAIRTRPDVANLVSVSPTLIAL